MKNARVNFATAVKEGADQLKKPVEYEYRERLLDLLRVVEKQLRSAYGWKISFSVESVRSGGVVAESHSIYCSRRLWGFIKLSNRLGSLQVNSKDIRELKLPIKCAIGNFVADQMASFYVPENFSEALAQFFKMPDVSQQLFLLFGAPRRTVAAGEE